LEWYTISDVEKLTGIKAHTLRIWEKRYNALIPHRTATNIRYYDDAQLKKLLNIATLLEQGYKASKLLSFSDDEINALVAGLTANQDGSSPYAVYINQLVTALLSFDEPLFDKTFSNIFIRFGVYNAIVDIVYPFLRKTGVLWSISDATPAQEHFASNVVKRKLLAVIDGMPYTRTVAKKYLLFLPPGQWHELGLIFADYIIRNAGGEVFYLGQSVPYSSLFTAMDAIKPDCLVTFLIPGIDLKRNIEEIQAIADKHPRLNIFICANVELDIALPPNLILLNEPGMIFEYL
jgi:hypothetical protein